MIPNWNWKGETLLAFAPSVEFMEDWSFYYWLGRYEPIEDEL